MARTDSYLIIIIGDVQPFIRGPYKSEKHRDIAAKSAGLKYKNGIFKLDITNGKPNMEAYSHGYFSA